MSVQCNSGDFATGGGFNSVADFNAPSQSGPLGKSADGMVHRYFQQQHCRAHFRRIRRLRPLPVRTTPKLNEEGSLEAGHVARLQRHRAARSMPASHAGASPAPAVPLRSGDSAASAACRLWLRVNSRDIGTPPLWRTGSPAPPGGHREVFPACERVGTGLSDGPASRLKAALPGMGRHGRVRLSQAMRGGVTCVCCLHPQR